MTVKNYFLYADDDPDDREIIRELLSTKRSDCEVITRNNGLELFHFLEKLEPEQGLPCCILLDINMPLWDGRRTLEELKKQKALQDIPVVIFTTSSSVVEADWCFQLGAAAFITKPVLQRDFETVGQQLLSYCQRSL